jgi:hypothetical protein
MGVQQMPKTIIKAAASTPSLGTKFRHRRDERWRIS